MSEALPATVTASIDLAKDASLCRARNASSSRERQRYCHDLVYAHYREAHKIHVVLARQVATSPVGFVDAMRETGGVGSLPGPVSPEANTADEVHWATGSGGIRRDLVGSGLPHPGTHTSV